MEQIEVIISFLCFLDKVCGSEEVFLLPEYLPEEIHTGICKYSVLKIVQKYCGIDYETAKPVSIVINPQDWCYYKLDFKKEWSQKFSIIRKYPPFDSMPSSERIAIKTTRQNIQENISAIREATAETQLKNRDEIVFDIPNNQICYKGRCCKLRTKSSSMFYCLSILFRKPVSAIPYEDILRECANCFNSQNEADAKNIEDSCRHMNKRLKDDLGLDDNFLMPHDAKVEIAKYYKDKTCIIERLE